MTKEESQTVDNNDWLPSDIILIDQSARLVDAWRRAFSRYPNVRILPGDYFQVPADAIVSPANSFGIMDGGIDLAIRNQLGPSIEGQVKSMIVNRYHGELPVGCAEILETGSERYPCLVCAPTMRIPERVEHTINAYLAFRAALLTCVEHNQATGSKPINSLLCCGLATGVGGMDAKTCASQMFLAYKSMLLPPAIGRFESIHEFHRTLRSV